ncbi:MAG: (2Fe-2S)-binding protein [Acidimicrobiales bacterium]
MSEIDMGDGQRATHETTHETTHEIEVSMKLNETFVKFDVPTSEMLVDTLRNRQNLTGTRIGCDQAACGACTVLIDGSPRASCSTFTWAADGSTVMSIEGAGSPPFAPLTNRLLRPGAQNSHDDLSPVQQAFAEGSAFQCGYCTPGLVLTTTALLREVPDPDDETIKEWLNSNICRCTGYQMVIEAVKEAAVKVAEARRAGVSS